MCPYCGATVYITSTTTVPSMSALRSMTGSFPAGSTDTERRLSKLETKINLMLVLQIGSFVLMIFALILLALR